MPSTTRLVASIIDLFGVDAFDAARATGVGRTWLFFSSRLHMLTLFLHLLELAACIPGEFRDLAEPVCLPGCLPISGCDVISLLQDRSSPA